MTMRSLYSIIFLLYVAVFLAQAPKWDWATSPVGAGVVYGTATDNAGNLYVTGAFRGDIILGSDTFAAVKYGMDYNYFLAKYDSTGNIIWARAAGGNKADYGLAVTTDVAGNVYTTGSTESDSIRFGSVLINQTGQNYPQNSFVVKYSPAGNILWVHSASGPLIGNQSYEIGRAHV